MKISGKRISEACAASLAALCCLSCISVDDTLGQEYIPDSHIWQVGNVTFDLEDIDMQPSSELGGYSSRRLCVGGVEDDVFGWNGRETALSLIPIADTTDFTLGTDPEFIEFHFAVAKDTVSVRDESQEHIIQNIRVYELKKQLDEDIIYAGQSDSDLYDPTEGVITEGVPTYNGGDSLSFNFSRAFGEKYLSVLRKMKLDTVSNYTAALPGICITADRPSTGSGRINMFKVAVSTNDYNYLTGNYAELKFRSTFDERGPIDTSLVFMLGAADFIGAESASLPTQYAFNFCKSDCPVAGGAAGEEIYVDGGCGLKPVLRADKLKEAVSEALKTSMKEMLSKSDEEGFGSKTDAEKDDAVEKIMAEGCVVINRATIKFPYKTSADYSEVAHYPAILSPTCRINATATKTDGSEYKLVSFAGLTDASVSSENQGEIDRSLNCYRPDVSHHIQELLRLTPKDGESEEDFTTRRAQYDIWFLILHSEINETSSSSSSSYNDYLSALAYSSYYNSLYNGYGYGGYGYGYGSYGYSSYYNNYYNYMMMAAYASQSSSTSTSTSTELDKDRYYSCRLYGPGAGERRPTMTITYSFPKEF